MLPGEDGQRVLRLIDLKRGESLQLTHRVQVLLYALELEAVVRQEGLDDVRVDLDTGGVWLGSHAAPTEFLVGDLRPHLESFLRQDLIRILRTAADEARWHVHFRCEWCEFFKHCWSQMQRTDDLSRLSRLTPWGKRFLTERAGVRTTAQLGELGLGRCSPSTAAVASVRAPFFLSQVTFHRLTNFAQGLRHP